MSDQVPTSVNGDDSATATVYHVAVLDENDILTGYKDVPALGPDDIEVPEMDLRASDYLWDRKRRTFVPIRQALRTPLTDKVPPFETAVSDALLMFRNSGMMFPETTNAYLDHYAVIRAEAGARESAAEEAAKRPAGVRRGRTS